ncbi:MAG: hypothetical protein O3B03_02585 [Proteobacteria bacterium]|nr:hypothetical protein [Pseudomonadota bacterium]
MSLPRIVLGHNAFFGVDHLSTKRGADRAAHFSDVKNVVAIVNQAVISGAGGLMLSTHPKATAICRAIQNDSNLVSQLEIFPLLPYAQKYVTRANELGLVRVVTQTLAEASSRDKFGLGSDFLRTVFRRDPLDMVKALMRLELRIFKKVNVSTVFLHDAITDLLLALNMPQIFSVYESTLQKRFGATYGVATKNLSLLVQRFREWDLELPVVLTHVNKVGFHVNPGREECEVALQSPGLTVMAMGTLASGFLTPSEAYLYVNRFSSVKSIVVGVSSVEHMRMTFDAVHNPIQIR